MASQVADARAATEHAVQTLSNNLFPAGASSGSGASAAGAAASKSPSPSTTEVSVAMAELNAAVAQQRTDLTNYMKDERPLVSRHLAETERLQAEAGRVSRSVAAVTAESDVHSSKIHALSEFVKHATARASAAQDQALAERTLAALDDAHAQYARLRSVEDAIWGGRIDGDVLDALGAMGGEPSSKIAAAIESRLALLRSTVAEQLSKAWSVAVVVSEGAVTVKRKLRLHLPTISRVTPTRLSAPVPPEYTVADLACAMSKLDILGQSLQTLHGSLISEVIDVLLAKRGTATTSEAKDNVSVQLGAGSSPKDTVDGIRTILQFVRSSLTAADLPGLHLFSTHLQHEAFSGVLSRLVLPSMPSTTSGLPVWLALVRACASCEEEFTDSSESGKGVLAQFAQRDAANRWLGKFRHVRLQRARGLFGSWATVGVKAVEVDVREEVQEVQDVEMLEVGVEALETPSAPIEAEEEGDSGWGFDDEDEPPAPAAEPEPAPADDDEDGWGFDDDTPAPTPAPKPKAPVREAKRLGKRVPRARSSSQSRSPSPPPAIPEPVPQPEPEPAPAPKPTLRARPTPPPAPLKLVRVVSAACDTVLAIPAEVLREIEAIRSLDEPTFADAPAGMADVLSEELDFICATIPVAVVHAEAQRGPSVGATLRMGNEYAYLADRLAEGNTSAWTAEASVERFKNTGELVRSTAVEEQLVELSSALDGARHFVEMSHDAFFREAQAAVSATMARLETVAAEAKPAVDDQQYTTFMGQLVESVVTRLLDEIVALDDITEVESERISSMLGDVELLETLFISANGSSVSSIAVHVPHWLKMCYIKEILHANLVDITYLFESGSLVDFKPAELSKLVQALFADSAKRSALLDKISAAQ